METLDITEAARILGISVRAVKDLCWAGKITYMKPNARHWRFRLSDIEEYQARTTFPAQRT